MVCEYCERNYGPKPTVTRVLARDGKVQRFCSTRCSSAWHSARTHKTCTQCGVSKPRADFSNEQGVCKPCRSVQNVKHQKANREKHAAHQKVRRAVLAGLIIKPESCERCGAQTRLESHHADYAKPLSVEWLCASCHRAEG